MLEIPRDETFRQILVALDDSSHSQAALKSAVSFAKRFDAHLKALFVEDINLHKAASVQTLQEINALTGEVRTVRREYISVQLGRISKRLRRLLEFIGRQTGIEYSFTSIKGDIEQTLLEHARHSEVDLLALGRMSRRIGRCGEIGTTAGCIIENLDKPVLILNREAHLGNSVSLIYHSGEPQERLLELAEQILSRYSSKLTIVSTSSKKDIEHDDDFNSFIDRITAMGIPHRIIEAKNFDVHMFSLVMMRMNPGLVITDRDHHLLKGKKINRFMRRTSTPLMLA